MQVISDSNMEDRMHCGLCATMKLDSHLARHLWHLRHPSEFCRRQGVGVGYKITHRG